jgi:hypothetical protein
MTESEPDNIPRIDKVGYLYETLGWINDGATFDEIREAQIAYRKEFDRDNLIDKRSGLSSGRLLEKRTNGETYWTNVRATVSELMRIGLVETGSVPSRKEQLETHRGRCYRITGEGAEFAALMERDFWQFQDMFAQAFLLAHPLARQLLALLAHRELFIPRLGTEDLREHIKTWPEVYPLSGLIEDVCERVRASGGPDIAPERLLAEFEPGIMKSWDKLDPTAKRHDFNKAVVKLINDQLLRAMVTVHRTSPNVIDFRAAVALLAGFSAVDSSHTLVGRNGWTIWSTSDAPPADRARDGQSPAAEVLAGQRWFSRRAIIESELQDAIIQCVRSIPNRNGGFALIHEVRARVCHALRIHSRSFNELLRKMHRGEIKHMAYRIYLDRGGYTNLPPSELPFVSNGKDFYLITFIPSKESHHGTR